MFTFSISLAERNSKQQIQFFNDLKQFCPLGWLTRNKIWLYPKEGEIRYLNSAIDQLNKSKLTRSDQSDWQAKVWKLIICDGKMWHIRGLGFESWLDEGFSTGSPPDLAFYVAHENQLCQRSIQQCSQMVKQATLKRKLRTHKPITATKALICLNVNVIDLIFILANA